MPLSLIALSIVASLLSWRLPSLIRWRTKQICSARRERSEFYYHLSNLLEAPDCPPRVRRVALRIEKLLTCRWFLWAFVLDFLRARVGLLPEMRRSDSVLSQIDRLPEQVRNSFNSACLHAIDSMIFHSAWAYALLKIWTLIPARKVKGGYRYVGFTADHYMLWPSNRASLGHC